MGWLRRRQEEGPRIPAFVQCPGCSYNFVTGEGSRSCNYYDCLYLPEELKVFCPECNYNFATGEGERRCDDTQPCTWAVEGRQHAKLANERFGPS